MSFYASVTFHPVNWIGHIPRTTCNHSSPAKTGHSEFMGCGMILIIRVRMDSEYLMGSVLLHAVLQDNVFFFSEIQDYLSEIAFSLCCIETVLWTEKIETYMVSHVAAVKSITQEQHRETTYLL